ncbi:unnamed protein product [Chrysoparadoxa australica]
MGLFPVEEEAADEELLAVADASEWEERRAFYSITNPSIDHPDDDDDSETSEEEEKDEDEVDGCEKETPKSPNLVKLTMLKPATELPARVRFILFPPAGATLTFFHEWLPHLPAWVDTMGADMPGRLGNPGKLPAFKELLQQVLAAIKQQPPLPTYLFGHEFGALLAFEAARHLERDVSRGCPQAHSVEGLFVSGSPPPAMLVTRPKLSATAAVGDEGEVLHSFNAKFDVAVKERGGLPVEVLACRELLWLFTPHLLADLTCMDSYRYEISKQKLACPVIALGGVDEAATLDGWAIETNGSFCQEVVGGNALALPTDEVIPMLQENIGLHLPEVKKGWSRIKGNMGGS